MKRLFVVCILIMMLAFVITACFIVKNKTDKIVVKNSVQRNNNSIENVQTTNYDDSPNDNVELYKKYHQNIEDGMTGVTLDDVFYKNSLIWNRVFYEDDKFAGYYYQIDGLKDKKVQKMINEKLFKSAMDFCDEHINKTERVFTAYYYNGDVYHYSTDSMEGNYYYLASENGDSEKRIKESDVNNIKMYFEQVLLSSFSNVISVATLSCGDGYVGYFGRNYYEYRIDDKYINIDLNTGNELSFESIFASNANIKAILYHSLYGEMALVDVSWTEIVWNEETGRDEKNVIGDSSINGPDSRKIEKLLNTFEHTKDLSFGFTPNQFFVHIGNYFCVKNYENILDDIAIFKRFLSDDSLFDTNSLSIRFSIKDYINNNYFSKDLDYLVKEGTLSVDERIKVDYKISNYSKDFNNKEASDIILEYLINNIIEKIKSNMIFDSTLSCEMKLCLYDTKVGIRDDYWGLNIEKYDELFNDKALYVISFEKFEINNNVSYFSQVLYSIFSAEKPFYVGLKDNRLFDIDNPLEYVMKDYSEEKLKQIGEELWKNFHENSYKKEKIREYHDYKLEKSKMVFKYQEYMSLDDNWYEFDKHFYIITYNKDVTDFYPLQNEKRFT